MRRATGATSREFFRYRLWNSATPLAERMSFMTWAQRRPLEAFLNPRTERFLVRSKLWSDGFYRDHGLPTPSRIGIWSPRADPRSASDRLRTRDELIAVIAPLSAGVVFKLDVSGGGRSVLVFTSADRSGLRHPSGEHWSYDRLIDRMAIGEPWLVQARVTAHPVLAALAQCDYTVTLRLVTCRRTNDRILLLPATLKLPSIATGVDNFGRGNVAIAVSEEGVMGQGALGVDGPPIDKHPVTGVRFHGQRVPDWDDAVALVTRGQLLIGELRSIGWDIAMTPQGPMILEGNVWWGADVLQQPGLRGVLRGEFIDFLDEIGAGHLVNQQRRMDAAR
ncbi:MAG: sugar-transfer associated ATP-grasp domain-containing protein [Gemmatimonadales bacterium]